jgi:hypothetical protein
LLALGYRLTKYGPDGKFGLETDAVVRAFQKKHCDLFITHQGKNPPLLKDGIVGPKTALALNCALARDGNWFKDYSYEWTDKDGHHQVHCTSGTKTSFNPSKVKTGGGPPSIRVHIGEVTIYPHNEFTQAVTDWFDDIDKKEVKNGFLSKKEIDMALGDSAYKGKNGAMVATLKKCLGDLEVMSADRWGPWGKGMEYQKKAADYDITRADIKAYDRLLLNDPNSDIVEKIEGMYNYAKSKINTTNKKLFVGTVDPFSVNQGLIGDCWFLAAIVGVALRSKGKEIRSMIQPLSGSRYAVKFPGLSKTITVTEPTDGEIAIFSTAGANGLWLTVLEKAFGASVNRDAYFFVDTSVTDAADQGRFTSKGIEIMTGHSVDTDFLVAIVAKRIELMTLRNKLVNAFQNKKVVTAGIRGGILSNFRKNGLPMGHAYTVLDFKPTYSIDGTTDMVHIRNPWGRGGAKWPKNWQIQKGAFEISLTDFWDNFSEICFEE